MAAKEPYICGRMKAFFKAFTFFISLWLLASCVNEPDCLNLRITDVQINFRKMFDGKADTVFVNGIEVEGLDGVFYANRLVTSVPLPLNYYAEETRFNIYQPGSINNIGIGHTRKVQLITPDCGERILIEDVRLKTSSYDSLRIINLKESNPVANINIYRCPEPMAFRFIFRTRSNGNIISEQVRVENLSADFFTTPFYSNTNIRAANLPINVNSNKADYYFEFESGVRDTLSITYNSLKREIFKVCGETTLYNQLKILSHTFQDAKIVRDSIREPAIINIEIFR